MNPPAPSPLSSGSTTPMAKAVAITASMALPPRSRISTPASAASGLPQATAPSFMGARS